MLQLFMIHLHVLFQVRLTFAHQLAFLAGKIMFVSMTLLNMSSKSKFCENLVTLDALFLSISILHAIINMLPQVAPACEVLAAKCTFSLG